MGNLLRRFGKFYSRVILSYIGIFIFVGILAVVFGDNGWIPNEDIYAISYFVYHSVIPILIAYKAGGQLAIMAVVGAILADSGSGIFAAMILGPMCGFLWEKLIEPMLQEMKTGATMLVRNLVIALSGCILAVASFYIFSPLFSAIMGVVLLGLNLLIEQNLICLASVIIEPAKIFFLNNVVNHGILVPLGLQQAEQTGGSILFLLESNPGPGLGILLALYWIKKHKRREYATGIFVEFIGGIHEVYFPEVLSNLWLLLALIGGGVSGNFVFSVFGANALGTVSPGSICSIFLVVSKTAILPVLAGIAVSAAVSFLLAGIILGVQKNKVQESEAEDILPDESLEEKQLQFDDIARQSMALPVHKVGFICDAGVGSSAMAAALFRRKLKEHQIEGIEVVACARDQIANDLDLAICQLDFKNMILDDLKSEAIRTVSSLLSQTEYDAIISEIKKRNGESV